MKKLSSSFYKQDTCEVAVQLLGKTLVRVLNGKLLKGTIVETEAYLGLEDPCCHSFSGRVTPRTQTMYLPAGHSYVYFTYGMHYCFNIVTGDTTQPEAVLIRALEPFEGIKEMQKNRNTDISQLTNGPSKLCQAFKIDRDLNAQSLLGNVLYIEEGPSVKKMDISPRIGLPPSSDAYYWPLRFSISENSYVSKKV